MLIRDKYCCTIHPQIRNHNVKQWYQIINVRKYTFDNTGNVGIKDVVDNSGLTFSQDGNVITLSPKGKTVQLFSTSGIELPIKAKNNGNGMLSIDMSGYVSGVYMLSVGNESIKIKKKWEDMYFL